MTTITTAIRFDDRTVDFLTGRKVSPPLENRRVCECCKQRIVKGFLTNFGPIGEDCYDVILSAGFLSSYQEYADRQRAIGWSVKPAIAKFLKESVYSESVEDK